MPINVLMPALSPTMEEGALARWAVKEGDTVKSGDVIAEIETDKATMEVEAVDEGVVGRLLVPEGAQGVKVNTVIAVLLAEGETTADLAGGAPAPAASAPAAPAPAPAAAVPHAPGMNGASAPAQNGGARVFASPLARRIAKDRGIDLSAVKGSGPHGRVVRADVEGLSATPAPAATPVAVPASAAAPVAAPASVAAPAPAPVSAEAVKKLYAGRSFTEAPLDGMRRTIAARLTEAKQTIPHFYLRRDIELDALLALRAQINAGGRGVKLSVNDFIIKACALTLKAVPGCNAVWAGDRVLMFSAADVAVAVAVEGGLFTPVIRDAEAKSLSAISAEMKDLGLRARARKLAPQEYQGGAFAISNLGMMGVENFDAVINPPHASILAVGAGLRKPVVKDETLGIATVMSVTLSVDHRVIDGALGADFLSTLKGFIEEPLTMLV